MLSELQGRMPNRGKAEKKKQKESAQKSEEKRGVDTKTTFNAIQQSCDSFCTLENKLMEDGLIKRKKFEKSFL